MNFLYAYRGWILGIMALVMLALPGAPISEKWTCEELPLSIACFVVFVLLRILSRRSIGEHTRGFKHDADRLVKEGIYSKIRHPLYLSNDGIGYALVILHFGFSLFAIPFVALLFVFEFLLSRAEDRFLENRFQDEWRAWSAVTPAFIPNLSRKKSNETKVNEKRSFLEAFKADSSTWFWLSFAVLVIMARKLI